MDFRISQQFRLFFFMLLLFCCVYGQPACRLYKQILMCQGQLPKPYELTEDVAKVIIHRLPDDAWLSNPEEDFPDRNIEQIEIRSSKIGRIEEGFFNRLSGPNSLKKLALQGVSGSAVLDAKTLDGLSSSLNELRVVGKVGVDLDAVRNLSALTELELHNANTSPMPKGFLASLPMLRVLELVNSNLSTLPWSSLIQWANEDRTRGLRISNMVVDCDCGVLVLTEQDPTRFTNTISQLTCGSPPELKGRDLRELTQAELCPPIESPVEPVRPSPQKPPNEVRGEDPETLDVMKGIRTEVIIAGAVVGALIFAFAVFIIGYKIHLSRKDKRVRNGPMHQSKRYW
uniref:Uncharacterized protein n=2 Tax=Schistocephalus solidus TaxID=70667 RepID=A0A0X3Q5C1_SCHSO